MRVAAIEAESGPVVLSASDVFLAVQAIEALQKEGFGDDVECVEMLDAALEELREFVSRAIALAAGGRSQAEN